MVNEKTRDAVTDVFIILDTRDVEIGTVLKNPLEMGTVGSLNCKLLPPSQRFCFHCYLWRQDEFPSTRDGRQTVLQDT